MGRLALACLAPLLCFALVETALRAAGYGHSASFFVKAADGDSYVTNPRFTWRFMSPERAWAPLPQSVAAKKTDGVFRIVVLGGSAAQGTPDDVFGFHRFLGTMLSHGFPETQFEIINAAVTAVNSPVVRTVARDCVRHVPDLFIVYMGNNEMIGPYAGGFPRLSPGLSRRLVRVGFSLRATRTGQAVARLFTSRRPPARLDGMGLFLERQIPIRDPMLARVHADFRVNLTDICRTATKAGVPVVLCTPACNLADCPPFASLHPAALSEADRTRWQGLFNRGTQALGEGKTIEAIANFEAAAAVDDGYAELHYCLGQGLLATGQTNAARKHLLRARDLDALRFRPDSQIAEIIKSVAQEQADCGVFLVDAEAAFAASPLAKQGLPGHKLFYEHVHMTPAGNYLLATCVYEQVIRILPGKRTDEAGPPPLSEERCRERCGLTAWDEYRMAKSITAMTSRPPFSRQYGHAERQALREKQVATMAQRDATPAALASARQAYMDALEGEPDHPSLRAGFARLLTETGDLDGAVREWRRLLDRFPDEDAWRIELGIALGGQGKSEEAIAEFRRCATETTRQQANVAFNLGSAMLQCGREDEALEQFGLTLAARPDTAAAEANTGAVWLQRKEFARAIAHFRKAIAIDPKSASTHSNLGLALAQTGDLDAAVLELNAALSLNARYEPAYRNLERVHTARGAREAALSLYRQAIAQMPDFAYAHFRVGALLATQADTAGAAAAFAEAFRMDPDNVENAHNLGVALMQLGQRAEAMDAFRHVLSIRPTYAPTLRILKRSMQKPSVIPVEPRRD